MQQTAHLAGFFAAHGIWNVSDGGALIPMLGHEAADGQRGMMRFAGGDIADGARAGREVLESNPDGAARAVLVVDAYLHLPAGRVDALMVDAVEYGPRPVSLKIAVPYRPQSSGFAVHRPKVLQVVGVPEGDHPALFEAFFAGVDAHEPAAAVWNAYLDESV
ncbi:hypothetical protein O7635_31105 [Asanoa sp. WMMD1127]|uniref:hypothetical protein n=1 Tax=Asanoa sp. WMMD1127 TaxID=3016107 RepID=UPI0024175150|nr:hypothetical protein [Asanoa sp. WMMD1127]MDG4826321.1 hypothetical protein [Asanoa sp. WMMD1127]